MRIGYWIAHDGVLPGFQSLALYAPAKDQTLVILSNSTIAGGDYHFPDAVAEKITPLLVPEPSVYRLLLLPGVVAALMVLGKIRGRFAGAGKHGKSCVDTLGAPPYQSRFKK